MRERYLVGLLHELTPVSVFEFFLLESGGDFLRVESLGDEEVVFVVVLFGFVGEDLDLGVFLLFMSDADHLKLYYYSLQSIVVFIGE